MNKNKIFQPSINASNDIINPEEESSPSYPSTKSSLETATLPSSRLKFRYTVVQRPKSSYIGTIFIFSFLVVLSLVFISSYNEKIKLIESSSLQEQAQCKLDYDKNRCDNPIKSIVKFCEDKKRCYESLASDHWQKKMKLMYLIGQIIKDFAEGTGLYVSIGLIAVFWVSSKKLQPKEVKKLYEQYFE